MHLALKLPDFASEEWARIPADHRRQIRAVIDVFREMPARGRTAFLQKKAMETEIKYPTLRTKVYALIENGGDWKVLIDKRKVADGPASKSRTKSPLFTAYLLKLVESYQRKNAPAFRELHRRWRVRDKQIAGYEEWPGWPAMPKGWSKRNLAKIVEEETTKATMASIRIMGTSSKTNPFLPQVLTTRRNLWPGAVIQLDDQWHDNWVTLGAGKNLQIVRALELGALDLFSAHRFHWGCKPRRRRENGSMENIGSADARLFIAGMLHRFGRSPLGTMLMVEHETMAISEDIERVLYDATGGALRVDRQPIEGKQAALTGFWNGSEGGNFRAKACLESTHNLIRNDASALPMQTGSYSSGIKGPVTTDRQVAYIQRILKTVLEKVPHRAHLLQLPTIDFHSQFIPFLTDYYEFGLAQRTDHELEGWEALGHIVTEYTTAPGSGHYLSESQFLALADATRAIISEECRREPAKWIRRRKLAPVEVWARRPDFLPIGPGTICDLIGQDLAREVKVDRGFVTFSDQDFAPEPIAYTSRFVSGPRIGAEIPHGEKVLMFANPFADERALVMDARGCYLGELPLYKRFDTINPMAFTAGVPFDVRPEIRSEELMKAAGEKHSRIADILAPIRIRHADQVKSAQDLRAHNQAVISGAPITPEEIHQARMEAGEKAARTAAANRLQANGNPIDWDTITPAPQSCDPFADLPDSHEFPDSI